MWRSGETIYLCGFFQQFQLSTFFFCAAQSSMMEISPEEATRVYKEALALSGAEKLVEARTATNVNATNDIIKGIDYVAKINESKLKWDKERDEEELWEERLKQRELEKVWKARTATNVNATNDIIKGIDYVAKINESKLKWEKERDEEKLLEERMKQRELEKVWKARTAANGNASNDKNDTIKAIDYRAKINEYILKWNKEMDKEKMLEERMKQRELEKVWKARTATNVNATNDIIKGIDYVAKINESKLKWEKERDEEKLLEERMKQRELEKVWKARTAANGNASNDKNDTIKAIDYRAKINEYILKWNKEMDEEKMLEESMKQRKLEKDYWKARTAANGNASNDKNDTIKEIDYAAKINELKLNLEKERDAEKLLEGRIKMKILENDWKNIQIHKTSDLA